MKNIQRPSLSYTNFRQEKQQKGCRTNIGLSIKYNVYINMSETYSITIFFFVPISEKNILLWENSHFWLVSKWPINQGVSLSIPTLCFIVICFAILNKKSTSNPYF